MLHAARIVAVALAAFFVVAVVDGPRSTRDAEAFSLPVHRSILDGALTGAMSADALDTVYGYFAGLVGSGNAGQDVFPGQYHAEYHVDSARNPEEICTLWSEGFQSFMDTAVRLSAPKGVEKRELEDRNGALAAFGQATHAMADFYSHTNWVELHADAGRRPGQAPLLDGVCNPSAFPPTLQSGYADMNEYIANGGASWCPGMTPPPGFTYCHDDLNKDEPEGTHGGRRPGPPGNQTFIAGETFHSLAVGLATQGTRDMWEALHTRIVKAYDSETVDGECVFQKLAFGGTKSCLKRWNVEGSVADEQRGPRAEGHDAGGHVAINVSFKGFVRMPEAAPPANAPALDPNVAEYARLLAAEGWNVTGEAQGTLSVSSSDVHPGTTYNCTTSDSGPAKVTIFGKLKDDQVRLMVLALSEGDLSYCGEHTTAPRRQRVMTYTPLDTESNVSVLRAKDSELVEVKLADNADGRQVVRPRADSPGLQHTVIWQVKLTAPRP
jgi:hypothetical protein